MTNSGTLRSPVHKQQFYEIFSVERPITDTRTRKSLPVAHGGKNGQPQIGKFGRKR